MLATSLTFHCATFLLGSGTIGRGPASVDGGSGVDEELEGFEEGVTLDELGRAV